MREIESMRGVSMSEREFEFSIEGKIILQDFVNYCLKIPSP